MKKRLIFAMLTAVLLVLFVSLALADEIMYVYTTNGKNVYVRDSMSTQEDNIRGSLPYGAKVTVYDRDYLGWALVDYGTYGDSYIMSRFLTATPPPPYNPGKKADASDFNTQSAATVPQLNMLADEVAFVEPYTVTVRPTRASGWVYLRWFPSRNAEHLATFSGTYQLTVIAELKDWYQVTDPQTGKTGFVYKSYIQK